MDDDEDSEHDDDVMGLGEGEEATGDASEKVNSTESTAYFFFLEAIPHGDAHSTAQHSTIAS